MRIELLTTDGGPVLEFLSELWVEAVPRMREYFVYDGVNYEVIEVTHNYDDDVIRVIGREVY